MKTEVIAGKYQSEIKWGIYLFFSLLICELVFTIWVASLVSFSNPQHSDFTDLQQFNKLVLVLLFLYFLFRCLKEIKGLKGITLLSSIGAGLRYLVMFIIMNTLSKDISGQYIIPSHKIDIQETQEIYRSPEKNLLNSCLKYIKRKLA